MSDTVPKTPPPNLLRRWFGWLKANALWLWSSLVTIGVVAYAVLVIRPFAAPDTLKNAEDVAASWNGSIARLGIRPIYPPQEDFYVGDVWAVVAGSPDQPQLGHAVRIGHIPMATQQNQYRTDEPVFPDTGPMQPSDDYRHVDTAQQPVTIPQDRVHTTLIAFPGIVLSSKTIRSASAGAFGQWLGAGGDDDISEEMRIPTAETYGLDAAVAAPQLKLWCLDDKHKRLCTDDYLRRLMSFTLGPIVQARTEAGAFAVTIDILLVNRVYLARSIEHLSARKAGRSASLNKQNPAEQGAAIPSPTLEDSRVSSAQISLKEVFQRPLAFGFRAVTLRPY